MSKIVSHDLNKLSDCKKYRDSVFRPIEKKKKKKFMCTFEEPTLSSKLSIFTWRETSPKWSAVFFLSNNY